MLSAWAISSVVCKFIFLVSLASWIGGLLCSFLINPRESLVQRHILKYSFAGAALGLLSSLVYFLLEIGAINQAGMSGMFDMQMGGILAQSGLGTALALRVVAFFLAMILVLFRAKGPQSIWFLPCFLVVAVLLASSFFLTGHVSGLTILAKLSIAIHVLAMSLWTGSLYPLWHICNQMEVKELKRVMKSFGFIAVFIVAVLLASGVYLISELLENMSEFITTDYGRSLIIKLISVTILLLFAAVNKLKLVPYLEHANGIIALRRSITMEMIVAAFILILTSYLTTVIGPGHI